MWLLLRGAGGLGLLVFGLCIVESMGGAWLFGWMQGCWALAICYIHCFFVDTYMYGYNDWSPYPYGVWYFDLVCVSLACQIWDVWGT